MITLKMICLIGFVIGLLFAVMLGSAMGLSKLIQALEWDDLWLAGVGGICILLAAIFIVGSMMASNERHEKKMAEIRGL